MRVVDGEVLVLVADVDVSEGRGGGVFLEPLSEGELLSVSDVCLGLCCDSELSTSGGGGGAGGRAVDSPRDRPSQRRRLPPVAARRRGNNGGGDDNDSYDELDLT